MMLTNSQILHPAPLTLAAQSLDPKIWFYFALLLATIAAGAIIIFALRKSLFTDTDLSVNAPGGGLLEHLDEMKRTGQITQEEYNATRQSIIDKAADRMREAADDANATPGKQTPK